MKKILLGLVAVFASLIFVFAPALAANSNCTPTSILGSSKCTRDQDNNIVEAVPDDKGEYSKDAFNCTCSSDGDKDGQEIIDILGSVVDIMTIGIGILGLIGITVVGIQYLTAGGDEAKTKKAKRRLFEIVVGLVAYVVLYAALKFILPGFNGTKV